MLNPSSNWNARAARCFIVTLLALASPFVMAQAVPSGCGDLANGYGPFDYRRNKDKLPIVEEHHFTPEVEALVRGISGPVGAELDYALRAFPNHPRVLLAMTRLGQREKTTLPRGAKFTIDCYFIRAVTFAPDDHLVRMLYARYLGLNGRQPEVGSSRVDLQACKLEYSIVSPK